MSGEAPKAHILVSDLKVNQFGTNSNNSKSLTRKSGKMYLENTVVRVKIHQIRVNVLFHA